MQRHLFHSVSLLGALRRCQRAVAFSSGAAPTSEAGRIVRFRSKSGEEHFGVFSDPQESKCFIAERVEGSPRLRVTSEETEVDLVLPPVDPPSSTSIACWTALPDPTASDPTPFTLVLQSSVSDSTTLTTRRRSRRSFPSFPLCSASLSTL